MGSAIAAAERPASKAGAKPPLGIYQPEIEGCFRPITTHQLCMAWWLHVGGHLTRRQLRIYFAAHEMDERRCYAEQEKRGSTRRAPVFGIPELRKLIGGGAPDFEIAADVERLTTLGLVSIKASVITFAVSVDQLHVEDVAGFWEMFNQVPNSRRSVPVPRRTLRGLAAGFSRAVTGVMLAYLIRGLYWQQNAAGYRVDNRTKGSWIADTFGISRRAVTDAKAKLVELGWLNALDSEQWQLNRWGARSQINAGWSKGDKAGQPAESASPAAQNPAESASPLMNKSSLPTEDLKTRSWGDGRPDPHRGFLSRGKGSRKKESAEGRVTLHDVQPVHLADDAHTLDLFYQATAAKLISGSEAGKLNFFALAERAKAHGKNPGALFGWLLRKRKFEFITQADEDRAVDRLRIIRNGKREQPAPEIRPRPRAAAVSNDLRLARAVAQVAEQKRLPAVAIIRAMKLDWSVEHYERLLLESEPCLAQ